MEKSYKEEFAWSRENDPVITTNAAYISHRGTYFRD